MLNQNNIQEVAHLEDVNAELTQSLDRCRHLLADCREKLAANSNEPETGAGDEPPAITTQDPGTGRAFG